MEPELTSDDENPSSHTVAMNEGDRLIEEIINAENLTGVWSNINTLERWGYINQRFIDFFSERIKDTELESFIYSNNWGYIKELAEKFESPKIDNPSGYADSYMRKHRKEKSGKKSHKSKKDKDFFKEIELDDFCRAFPEIDEIVAKQIQRLADEADDGRKAYAARVLGKFKTYSPRLEEWMQSDDKCIKISTINALGRTGHLHEDLFVMVHDDNRDIESAAWNALYNIAEHDLGSARAIDDNLIALLFHEDKAANIYAMRRIHNIINYHGSSLDPDEESKDGFPSRTDMQKHMDSIVGKNMIVTSPTAPAPKKRNMKKIVPEETYTKATSKIASFLDDEDGQVVYEALHALGALEFFDERMLSVFGKDFSDGVMLEALLSSYKAGCPVRRLGEIMKSSQDSLRDRLMGYIYNNIGTYADIIVSQCIDDSPQASRDIAKALIKDEDIARCLLIECNEEDRHKLNYQRTKIIERLGKDKVYMPCMIELVEKEQFTIMDYLEKIFDLIREEDVPRTIDGLTQLLTPKKDYYGSTAAKASRLLARLGHFDDDMLELLASDEVYNRRIALDAIAELYEKATTDKNLLTKKICGIFDRLKDKPKIVDISCRLRKYDNFFISLTEHEFKANIHERLAFTRDHKEKCNLLSAIDNYADALAAEKADPKEKPYYDSMVKSLRNVVFDKRDEYGRFWAYKILLKLSYFSTGLMDTLNDIAVERSGQIDISQTSTGDLLDSLEKIAITDSPFVDKLAGGLFYQYTDGKKYTNFFENTDKLIEILKAKHPDIVQRYIPSIKQQAERGNSTNAAILLLKLGHYDFDFLAHMDREIETWYLNDKRGMRQASYGINQYLPSIPREVMLERVSDRLGQCTDENTRQRLQELGTKGRLAPKERGPWY